MGRPFHCDAEFLPFLDGRRCVLRLMIALVIGLVACGMTAASAQTYPQRPVKFILPFGPAAGNVTASSPQPPGAFSRARIKRSGCACD